MDPAGAKAIRTLSSRMICRWTGALSTLQDFTGSMPPTSRLGGLHAFRRQSCKRVIRPSATLPAGRQPSGANHSPWNPSSPAPKPTPA